MDLPSAAWAHSRTACRCRSSKGSRQYPRSMLRLLSIRSPLRVTALVLLAAACERGGGDRVLYDLTAAYVTAQSPVATFTGPGNAGAILTWTCDKSGGVIIFRGNGAEVRQSLSCDSSGHREVTLTPGARYRLELRDATDGTATIAFG